jgi:hypothetical protein
LTNGDPGDPKKKLRGLQRETGDPTLLDAAMEIRRQVMRFDRERGVPV